MSGEEKADEQQIMHLKKELASNISSCDGSAWHNTMKAFRIKICSLVFSALTTIALGVIQSPKIGGAEIYISIAALITSSVVSGFAGWEAFFSYRERWHSFTLSAQNLRRVLDELNYATAHADGITKAQLDTFFKRYQKALQDAHTGWISKKEAKAMTEMNADSC